MAGHLPICFHRMPCQWVVFAWSFATEAFCRCWLLAQLTHIRAQQEAGDLELVDYVGVEDGEGEADEEVGEDEAVQRGVSPPPALKRGQHGFWQ